MSEIFGSEMPVHMIIFKDKDYVEECALIDRYFDCHGEL
jgi:hypothetical protein